MFSGQAGEHQKRRHSRREPQAHPGVNMDHHPPLPGLLRCQCCVPLYYRSLPLSLGSEPVGRQFQTPWKQSPRIFLLKIALLSDKSKGMNLQ